MTEMPPIQMADWIELLPRLLLMMLVASPPAIIGFIVMRRGRSWVFFALGLISTALLLAIALPSIRPARPMAERNTCIANLKIISEAKRSWAALTKPEASVAAQPADLAGYLRQGLIPVCPTGGTYTLGAVNELPRCSHAYKGHRLEPPAASPKSDGR